MSLPALSVKVDAVVGKHGHGSILEGQLDDEFLDYLQQCPTWAILHAECKENDFMPNDCISE